MLEIHHASAHLRKTMAALLTLLIALGPSVTPAFAAGKQVSRKAAGSASATPIHYLVVIFQENVSFDHYFGTYPNAANPPFENAFTATAKTPTVNGLSAALLGSNPNLNPANGSAASNPFRLDYKQAATADQDHNYLDEQLGFDAGLMDLFPAHTGNNKNVVMGYFDGNTVMVFRPSGAARSRRGWVEGHGAR